MNLNQIIRLEKHKWIAERVKGKSFIDVGGLWGVVNETVTIAAKSGASSYTMADIQVKGNELWQKFAKHCEERGVKNYETLITDICDEEAVSKLDNYDFVHCSGIVYHVSDPIQFIQNLIQISNEYVCIGSMTIPELIKNTKGQLLSRPGTSHLVPAVDDETRSILVEFFENNKIRPDVAYKKTYTELFKESHRVRTGPWWWIFTPDTLKNMCEICGLTVIEVNTSKNGIYTDVLCKK